MIKKQQLNEEETGPLSLAWSNPEPQPFTIGEKADMRVVKETNLPKCTPKPALIGDAETGKKLAVLSFQWGDRLNVVKAEAVGLPEGTSLEVLGYSHDSQQQLYAITAGTMPARFRNAETEEGASEVVFRKPLPARVAEWCLVDHNKDFTLQRYKYQPEVNPVTKQILLPFKEKAA